MSVIPDVMESVSVEIRLMAAYIDAHLSGSMATYETAVLRERDPEDREGWNFSKTERFMRARGWTSAEDIYNEAGIPEKHRPVLDLALFQDPQGSQRSGGLTDAEIAHYTGHPERTVQLWIYNGRERLAKLNHGVLADSSGIR